MRAPAEGGDLGAHALREEDLQNALHVLAHVVERHVLARAIGAQLDLRLTGEREVEAQIGHVGAVERERREGARHLRRLAAVAEDGGALVRKADEPAERRAELRMDLL